MKNIAAIIFSSAFLTLHSFGISYIVGNDGKTEWVGTGASVPGSGTVDNFATGTVVAGSTFAKFRMLNASDSQRAFDMKVTVSGFVGTFNTNNNSGLMIAQTSDSQGLTDSGTLSVLTSFNNNGGATEVTLLFEFFMPERSDPVGVAMEITSFDYDYSQYLRVNNSDFTNVAFGSLMTQTNPTATTTRWESPNNSVNAVFTDPKNAVALNNVADSSFSITLGKLSGGGNSLFMFEFRDPSVNLSTPLTNFQVVPEPSVALFAGLSVLLLQRRRRS
jgi:hypothetical protein